MSSILAHTFPLAPADTHPHKWKRMSLHRTHKTNEICWMKMNQSLQMQQLVHSTVLESTDPDMSQGVTRPCYILSMATRYMNNYAQTYMPTPMSQVRPGRAEFCKKACVWWSRSPRSWYWVWAPASRSPRDNGPARPGRRPRSPSETTGTFQKCHRCFDSSHLGSRAGHAERRDKMSAFCVHHLHV